jgi:hypothetical protein
MKYAVYAKTPRHVEHVKALISTDIAKLHTDKDLCSAICRSVVGRGILYLQHDGGHFEQFLQ